MEKARREIVNQLTTEFIAGNRPRTVGTAIEAARINYLAEIRSTHLARSLEREQQVFGISHRNEAAKRLFLMKQNSVNLSVTEPTSPEIHNPEKKRGRRPNRNIDYSTVDPEIKKLRESGMAAQDISQRLGLTRFEYGLRVSYLTSRGELELMRRGRRTEITDPNIEAQIKAKRAEGLPNEVIREQLKLTPSQYRTRLNKLLKVGEVQKLSKRRKPNLKGGARFALEQVLDRLLDQQPDKLVNFSKLGKETGYSREMVRVHYAQIAAEKAVPPVASRKLKETQSQFDQKVQDLAAAGKTLTEISDDLKVTRILVKKALSRLYRQKLTAPENEVTELRKQGLGNQRISEITGINLVTVQSIISRLTNKDNSLRLRKKRRSPQEIARLEETLVQLRTDPRNLTNREIVQITGLDIYSVENYIHKLISEGRITKRKNHNL